MTGVVRIDDERNDFYADFIIDADSKKITKKSMTNAYVRRVMVELPTVALSIGLVITSFIGYFVW